MSKRTKRIIKKIIRRRIKSAIECITEVIQITIGVGTPIAFMIGWWLVFGY